MSILKTSGNALFKWMLLLAVAGGLASFAVTRAYQRDGFVRDTVVGLVGPPAREAEELYSQAASGPDVDHSLWDTLLAEHVDGAGRVDYDGFGQDAERLERYLTVLENAGIDALGRDERLALMINAYNAFTVKLIVENLPLDSIRDIPAAERWDARRWQLGGSTWSLTELEHDAIRVHFEEPRIHFALVCAAVGCPPLAREAYVASRLEEQLERQARYVHEHEAWLRFDEATGVVHLTELYSWYDGDFVQAAGSALAYAARYVPSLRRALDENRGPEVRWIPYDWRLNAWQS